MTIATRDAGRHSRLLEKCPGKYRNLGQYHEEIVLLKILLRTFHFLKNTMGARNMTLFISY